MNIQKDQLSLTTIMIVGKKQECSKDRGFGVNEKIKKIPTVIYKQNKL